MAKKAKKAKKAKASSAKAAKTRRRASATKPAKKAATKRTPRASRSTATSPAVEPPPGDSTGSATSADVHASTSAAGTISVRMYRGLLGDFFFLKHSKGPKTFKMLIDCGVLQRIGTEQAKPATSRGKQRLITGVKDFVREIGGSIDLVVATHEHYDHLSGFIAASEDFQNLKIGKVWMAWTEDRADQLANGYRNKKNKALAALTQLSTNPALAATSEMDTVRNLLQFYEPPADRDMTAAMKATGNANGGRLSGNSSCEGVLEWLRSRAGMNNVSFLKPGAAVKWGVDDALRAYVLGPPRDDEKLRQLDPSKGAAREVYLARGEDVETVTGLAAVHSDHDDNSDPHDENLPFEQMYLRAYGPKGRKIRRKKNQPSKARKLDNSTLKLYEQDDPLSRDRRIDTDWLGGAENLALKIDGDVNNTSLALALELADKQVLLFPGDAQVGNWLSWGDQTYPADDAKDGPKLKIEELLSRTILYKVGHHASHNATLRDRGLELMTHPQLCAMIPVVEDIAHEQKTKSTPGGWAMPYGDLYKRLKERTGERIVRGDGDTAAEKSKFDDRALFKLSYGAAFAPNDPLWVELSLK